MAAVRYAINNKPVFIVEFRCILIPQKYLYKICKLIFGFCVDIIESWAVGLLIKYDFPQPWHKGQISLKLNVHIGL